MTTEQWIFWNSLYRSSKPPDSELQTLIYHQRKQRQSILKRHLPHSSRITLLEAGCGQGEDLLSLSMPNAFIIGLDYSINAIRTCAKLKKQVNCDCDFVLGDILHLPFRDNSFDLVFNAGVIEHFANHLAPLKEMIRVTDVGRRVVIFVPNMFSWWVLYKHILNLLSRISRRIKGWGVWEKSFNWFTLKEIGDIENFAFLEVEGIHLLHYCYPMLMVERKTRPELFKAIKHNIINFLIKLDARPTTLSKWFGMELALIGKKTIGH